VAAETGIPSHIHKYHDEIVQIMEGEGKGIIGKEYHTPCLSPALFYPFMRQPLILKNPDRVFL
jgi:hypothetical protein